MISLILFTSAIGAVIYYLFFSKDGKKYPKGPFALPLLGNLHQMSAGSHKMFPKWANQYGGVFRIKMGPALVYVISDLKAVKEAFNDPALNARPPSEGFELFRSGPHGIVASSGEEWVEQRRFTLRHLRDFGFGKSGSEEKITAEVNELLSAFSKQTGKPFMLDRTFNVAVLNTLWMITTGNRYSHDDPELWSVFNQLQELMDKIASAPVVFFVPKVAKLFPDFFGWNMLVKMTRNMQNIIQCHINQHEKTFPDDGVPRDFMDAYLSEISKTTDTHSSFHKSVGNRSLKATMVDFFIGGSDTVTTTLLWGVLYLCKFPQVQKKFQDELDKVVGRNRYPTLADRPKLPYWEALLAEITRYSSIVPGGLIHYAAEDRKILGFDCPKGTQIMANIYGIHFSEKYFDNPKEFRPERFLSSDGMTFRKSDAVIPFGYGKRVCPGETLARDELFLFMANIFHRFEIKLAEESKDVSMEAKPRFILAPDAYKVVICNRD